MTMFKVEELEAGPLLDQAVLLAMGAMRVLDPPANAPANVRERWPDGGCLVLVDGGNMAFYGAPPPFSTDWGIGGPALIDKARLSLLFDGHDIWWAAKDGHRLAKSFSSMDDEWEGDEEVATGQDGFDTALALLCRAFVASKVGPTIELRQPAWNVGTPTVTQGPPPGGEG